MRCHRTEALFGWSASVGLPICQVSRFVVASIAVFFAACCILSRPPLRQPLSLKISWSFSFFSCYGDALCFVIFLLSATLRLFKRYFMLSRSATVKLLTPPRGKVGSEAHPIPCLYAHLNINNNGLSNQCFIADSA